MEHIYCRGQAPDGRVCSLYAVHYGYHKEKHGASYFDNEGNTKTLLEAYDVLDKKITEL